MKYLILALMLIASPALAAPFLVCDPSPQAVGLSYEVWHAGKLIYSGTNEPDGSFRIDLKTLPVGDYEFQALYKDRVGNRSDLSAPGYIHATPYYVTWTSCKPETVKLKRK